MAHPTICADVISKIIEAEKKITLQDAPVADGPTAMAQKHLEDTIDSQVLRDITAGEKNITQETRPVAGGPTAVVQSHLSKCANGHCETEEHHDGKVNAEIISKITAAEKSITHEAANVVAGGPTAMAQKHYGQKIDGKVLQDIAEGENKITGGNCPTAGGPTAIVQSELSKSRM